jgi:hypothetical protein
VTGQLTEINKLPEEDAASEAKPETNNE